MLLYRCKETTKEVPFMEYLESYNQPKQLSIPAMIGTVIFFISFLPYVHLIYAALRGVMFGMQGFVVCYGYGAIIVDAIALTFYLIMPACFIYQLIFGKAVISKHPALKRAVKILVIVLIVAALLTEPLAFLIYGKDLENDPDKVREFHYLTKTLLF